MKEAFILYLISIGLIASAAWSHDYDDNKPLEYKRQLYGGWKDYDSDCFNTRAEILIKHNIGDLEISEDTCRITGGRWEDSYDGQLYENPSILDVDHLVPLKEAHITGGNLWDVKKRQEFANDEENLFMTHQSLNRSKGAKGIDKWLPPTHICPYIEQYLYIKQKHGLLLRVSEILTIQKNNCKI